MLSTFKNCTDIVNYLLPTTSIVLADNRSNYLDERFENTNNQLVEENIPAPTTAKNRIQKDWTSNIPSIYTRKIGSTSLKARIVFSLYNTKYSLMFYRILLHAYAKNIIMFTISKVIK